MSDNCSEELKPFLVRVVTDFDSGFNDELICSVNDLVQIESKLDKYWLFGHINGRTGKIPVANCREVELTANVDNQCLFAATNDFINDCIDGDLRFKKGDLIIGLAPIDENWWNGYLYTNPGVLGIFPMTHVWRLDPNLLPKSLVKTSDQTTNDIKYAKVMVEMRSQLDNEIDLFKDEIIKITDNYDKMYFKGESIDGQRKGIFPKNFVKIIDDYQPNNDQSPTNNTESVVNPNNSTYMNVNANDNLIVDSPPSYDNVINSYTCAADETTGEPSSLGYSNAVVGEVESYGRTLFPFKAEYPNELSLKQNEIVHLIRHIDNEWIEGEIDGRVGIFPKSFVEIIVDCDLNTGRISDDNQNISISEEFPPDSFGRVLYDFDGELDGDLKVKSGDTLTLIRKIDKNWLEVMDDSGSVGLVPNNFVELIEDISSNTTPLTTPSVLNGNVIDITGHSNINGNHIYPFICDSFGQDLSPVSNHKEIAAKQLDQLVDKNGDNNNNDNNLLTIDMIEPMKMSPKIPRRPAPAVPVNDRKTTARNAPQVSPHRPPPPVPKHKSNRKLPNRTDSIDSLSFNRQESVRSSIASNSSSGSAKSDVASGVTITVPSAEDQRRTEERKKKVREQRGCVIMELLQTERDYKQNLAICAQICLKNPEEGRRVGIDMDKLFGNLHEVIDVSARLVQLLEESTLMKTYERQRVGKCFLEISDQLNSAYSTYCSNHDEVQPLFKRYEAQTEAKQFLDQKLEQLREATNCFDIPSFLIKPVQRILKYPLLLNELHKCTEDGHEDKPDLILTIDKITNMATNINESKRRQDLVHKYREEPSHRLTARLSKLNLHTVMKKGSRLGHRITSTLGLSNTTKDDEFNKEVQKFKTVEKTIKIFVKDKQAFMKSAQDFSTQGLTFVETIAEYYDKKNRQQEVEQLRTAHRTIVTQYWNEFNVAVDRDVTPVLDKLLSKFSGPNQLIRKRFDKLTDYDSTSKKLECNKDTIRQRQLQDQQNLAKNVYEALNTQLLEELPKLCDLSMLILQDCIQAFLLARKQLIGRIAKYHLSLLELPLVMSFNASSAADINETFQIKHNLITDQLLDELSILPSHVFPNSGHTADISRKHSTRSSRRSLSNVNISVANTRDVNRNTNKNASQSDCQRAYLQSRYKNYQLYEAVKPYEAVDVLEICVNKGDLLGVIKQQDPMGDKRRWYVDAGSAQGFILSAVLVPYHNESWAAPPNWQSNTNQQYFSGQSVSEKTQLNRNVNQSPNPTPNYDKSHSTPVPSAPIAQHQYKLHPSPEPSVQLRHDIEEHRYELVEDSPPRYSNLDVSGSSNLLSFEDSIDEKCKSNQHLSGFNGLDEFDPYAPIGYHKTQPIAIDHRYEEIPEDSCPPPTPQRQSSIGLYFAAYPFTAGDQNQLSLEFGQPVYVQHRCDTTGNTDWWFVIDRDGNKGYVPANYLTEQKSN